MGTLIDKLNATNATKEQIRQAIERKKVSVPENTPLKDYPAKIDGIYPDALFLEPMQTPMPIGVNNWSIINCASGNGIIAVLFQNSEVWVSVNNKPFEKKYSFNSNSFSFAFGNDWMLMLDQSNKEVYRTNDGKTWTKIKIPNTSYGLSCTNIIFDGEKFVFLNYENNTAYFSKDGVSFEEKRFKSFGDKPKTFVFNNLVKKYFVFEMHSNKLFPYVRVSSDALTWELAKFYNDSTEGTLDIGNLFNYFQSFGNTGNYMIFKNETFSNSTKMFIADMKRFADNTFYGKLHAIGEPVGGSGVMATLNGIIIDGNARIYPDGNYSIVNKFEHGSIRVVATNEYFISSGNKNEPYLRYSYDGINFLEGLDVKISDVNGNNKTLEVLKNLSNLQTAALQAAYEAGVNSI